MTDSTFLHCSSVSESPSVTQPGVPQGLCSDHIKSGNRVFIWLFRPEKLSHPLYWLMYCDIEVLPFIFLLWFLGTLVAKGSLATGSSRNRLLPYRQ